MSARTGWQGKTATELMAGECCETTLGLAGKRNGKRELRSLADSALNPQAPTVRFHDVLGNRKPQPGTAGFPRSRSVHSVKALENPLLVGKRYSNSGI